MDEVDVIVVGRGTSADWQITSPGMMEACQRDTSAIVATTSNALNSIA